MDTVGELQRETGSSLIEPAHADQYWYQLQKTLQHCWRPADDFDEREVTILVVPSLTLNQHELEKISGVNFYEERLLFSLIRLKNPRTRLIYVTSQPLHPSIVDYYLELLPGIPSAHARERLTLFCTYDSAKKPLTQKILERPRLLERIRRSVQTELAYMTCYNSTELERQLSIALDLPLLALDPDLLYWGTKSGSRKIFAECGILHPDGSEQVWSEADLAEVTADLWERQPDLQRIVIKLNEGFSGEGNAILDVRSLPSLAPGSASHRERVRGIRENWPRLAFQCLTEQWDHFNYRIEELGAIAEAFIEGDSKRSPSVQGRINPGGNVEVLSTHDQVLGGPDGQIFLGCSFPAAQDYRLALQEMGRTVGEALAAKGALERYGVDFIAVPSSSDGLSPWQLYAIEINLRKGGTTHPFMALKLLIDGYYHLPDGLYYSHNNQPKYYQATDNLQKEAYRGLLPSDLMDIIVAHRLHFNSSTGTGVAFHLMGCLSEFGKLGVTSIGNTPEEAARLYQRVEQVIDQAIQETL